MSQTPLRNGSIDLLRFAGAVGIVWFHLSMPGAKFALAALPMFVILLVWFGAGRPLAARARRLLIPWGIWSAVFALAKVGEAWTDGAPLAQEFAPWMLLTGTALHLWFLTFCFAFLLLTHKLDHRWLWPASIVVTSLALWALNSMPLAVPFAQWASVLPAAFFGLLLARGYPIFWLSTGFMISMLVLLGLGWGSGTLQLFIGAMAIFLAIRIKTPSVAMTSILSDLSLGVYLIHPLVYALALRLRPDDGLLMFGIVLGFSVLATIALKRVLPLAV